jgi:hypothetical protein
MGKALFLAPSVNSFLLLFTAPNRMDVYSFPSISCCHENYFWLLFSLGNFPGFAGATAA